MHWGVLYFTLLDVYSIKGYHLSFFFSQDLASLLHGIVVLH